MGELIRPHDRIQVEQSLKFSEEEAEQLWQTAGMIEIGQWKYQDEYGMFGSYPTCLKYGEPLPFREVP